MLKLFEEQERVSAELKHLNFNLGCVFRTHGVERQGVSYDIWTVHLKFPKQSSTK